MKPILIISHGSPLEDELDRELSNRGYDPVWMHYTELSGIANKVKNGKFDAVLSAGGDGMIGGTYTLGNGVEINPELRDETNIWYICQKSNIPLLGMNHGGQIGAKIGTKEKAGGELYDLPKAREGINFLDYVVVKNDLILNDVDAGDLKTLEWHSTGIQSVGESYDEIMTSPGGIMLAKHKDSQVYICGFNPYAKRPKKGPQETNGEIIFDNFLDMVA